MANADKNYSIRLANAYTEMKQYKVSTIKNVTQEFKTWFKIYVKSDLIKVNLNLKTFCKTDKLYNKLFNLQQINQTKVNYQSISISTQEQRYNSCSKSVKNHTTVMKSQVCRNTNT